MDVPTEPVFDIFKYKKKWSFVRLLKMTAQTVLGRLIYLRPPALADRNYMNLCCGKNFYEGWINADFYFSKSTKLFRPKDQMPNWRIDLRRPLRCPDGVVDGVFSEHTIEHIDQSDARRLLNEIYRIMKPGGHIRIAVPDLEKYVGFYTSPAGHDFEGRFRTGAEAIANISQNWFHLSLWDHELLARELADAGFVDIAKCAFGEGSYPDVLKDDPKHAWETLYIEARKPAA